LSEAKKVFEEEFGGTMFTIAKDVKIQIEFNPYLVQNYRMIGYENRLLAAEDFNDDTKDAGEMGAGHSVTVIYELIPSGEENKWEKKIDPLKYFSKKKAEKELTKNSEEIGVLKFRYKEPQGIKSTKWESIIPVTNTPYNDLSNDTKWAIQVALYAQLLRESKYVQSASYENILSELNNIENLDKHQSEFIELVELTEILNNNKLSVKE
jgi:Ca-activated chloride channel family protein